MSSVSSTPTLAGWDPLEVLELTNPEKLGITCVGHAASKGRRCQFTIARCNIQAAKDVMRRMVQTGLSDDSLRDLLFELAGYTLCKRFHQDQAQRVSDTWFGVVQRHSAGEEDHGSDTSDNDDDDDNDSDTSSGSDGSSSTGGDGARARRNNTRRAGQGNAQQRQNLEEIEDLQRRMEEYFRRQRQTLFDDNPRGSSTSYTSQTQQTYARTPGASEARIHEENARRAQKECDAEQARQQQAYLRTQRERQEARERCRRESEMRARVEQARREAAERQARREKAAREAKEAKAKLERERLRQEEAERTRIERERQQREREKKSRASSWEAAWLRYEEAWSKVAHDGTDTDIRTCDIWPTMIGSYASCCEEDVKRFFRFQPGIVTRNMVRRQAFRWHPDRAVRLFAYIQDEVELQEMMAAVTMISQVVIGIMGVSAQ